MKFKRISMTAIFVTVSLFVLQMVNAQTTNPKIEKKRQEIRSTGQDTLTRLYKVKPEAKKFLEGAAGYAVFVSKDVKVIFAGGGGGNGLAVNNSTKKETFMKMMEINAGIGVGAKKSRLIFVFETEKALNDFANAGWEMSGEAAAAAKLGEGKGGSAAGAVAVADGVWAYQLTDKGVVAELSLKGTKYSKDDDLNK